MDLEKEFCPYEQALALKELGFDELCFYQYVRDFDNDGGLIPIVSDNNYPIIRNNTQISNCSGGDCFAAPTFSQAFRFFREKFNLQQYICPTTTKNVENVIYFSNYSWYIFGINGPFRKTNDADIENITYEQSELECLKKLIEIVKNK
jgi:hypothetical protein